MGNRGSKSAVSFFKERDPAVFILMLVFSLCVLLELWENLLPMEDLTDILFLVSAPIFKYENADLNKLQILKENRGKAGIYR
jgi:hypothetical protein